jgi:GDPmannose 4,6-dehydratase
MQIQNLEKKRALITGITGQDGSYLAEYLLEKGYQVFGLVRPETAANVSNLTSDQSRFSILRGDLTKENDIVSAIQHSKPHEIYNLASQSRPGASWKCVTETLLVNGLAAVTLFESVKEHSPTTRVYHASSSEMFGQVSVAPQNEQTPFNPLNPYATAKVYAHQMARIYRESYGLYIASGILFNHESERRPLHFLTQKVAYGAACVALGIVDSPDLNEMGKPIVSKGKLALGNLEIRRDWGYAGDFVQAMWLILQQEQPEDFVIGTGLLHTLQDLCEVAYGHVGHDWRTSVISDAAFVRPLDSDMTQANPQKAYAQLGWKPKVSFEDMVKKMVTAQLVRLKSNLTEVQCES